MATVEVNVKTEVSETDYDNFASSTPPNEICPTTFPAEKYELLDDDSDDDYDEFCIFDSIERSPKMELNPSFFQTQQATFENQLFDSQQLPADPKDNPISFPSPTSISETIDNFKDAEPSTSTTLTTSKQPVDFLINFASVAEAYRLGVPRILHCNDRMRSFLPDLLLRCSHCRKEVALMRNTFLGAPDWETVGKSPGWVSLVSHARTWHCWRPEGMFLCSCCGLGFQDAKQYYDHSFRMPSYGFMCLSCKFPFERNAVMYHLKRYHSSDLDKNRLVWGEDCLKVFIMNADVGNSNVVKFTSMAEAKKLDVRERILCDGRSIKKRILRVYCGCCYVRGYKPKEEFVIVLKQEDADFEQGLLDYWHHVEREHIGKCAEPYCCFTCKKGFSDRKLFLEHTFQFPNSGYCCKGCGKPGLRLSSFIGHECRNSDTFSKAADLDGRQFSVDCTDSNRKIGGMSGSLGKGGKIPPGKGMDSFSPTYTRGVMTKRYEIDSVSQKVKCLECGKMYDSVNSAHAHLKRSHVGITGSQCRFCGNEKSKSNNRHKASCIMLRGTGSGLSSLLSRRNDSANANKRKCFSAGEDLGSTKCSLRREKELIVQTSSEHEIANIKHIPNYPTPSSSLSEAAASRVGNETHVDLDLKPSSLPKFGGMKREDYISESQTQNDLDERGDCLGLKPALEESFKLGHRDRVKTELNCSDSGSISESNLAIMDAGEYKVKLEISNESD